MVRLQPGRDVDQQNIARLTEIEQDSDRSQKAEAPQAQNGTVGRDPAGSHSVHRPECHTGAMWFRCPRCRELLYTREHKEALQVCSKCKYHVQVSARERITMVLDEARFSEYDAGIRSADPLLFVSMDQPYAQKLQQYSDEADINEAFLYGTGAIEGQEAVVGATDFRFCGGTMGAAHGEKVMRAIELAERECLPLVLFSSGSGARIQEGAISLLQMAKTLAALNCFKDAGLPYFSVITDPCLGGITSSYALLGEVNIAEPGANIGFAGRRVIEQTMRQELPHDVATAEFLQRHGMVDLVIPRSEIRRTLARLIRMYVSCNRKVRKQERIQRRRQ